jgi:hypothetical protein
MKNRIVGFIITGFALILVFMAWLYNRALTEIVNENCSHGPTCPMWESVNFQTNINLLNFPNAESHSNHSDLFHCYLI